MHFATFLIAAISTTLVAANPLVRRSDYITCLEICSADNSQCVGTSTGNTVTDQSVKFGCGAEALACQAVVCEGTQNVQAVVQYGFGAAQGILAQAGYGA